MFSLSDQHLKPPRPKMTKEEAKAWVSDRLGFEFKELQHHKDTTVGLYATDKPELVPEEIRSNFFYIK